MMEEKSETSVYGRVEEADPPFKRDKLLIGASGEEIGSDHFASPARVYRVPAQCKINFG